MDLDLVIRTLVAPGAVMALALSVLWQPWRRRSENEPTNLTFVGIAVAVAVLVAHLLLFGVPRWADWASRPTLIVLGAAIAGTVMTISRDLLVRLVTATLLTVATIWLLDIASIRSEFSSDGARRLWLGVIGVALWGLILFADAFGARRGGLGWTFCLGLCAAAVGAAAIQSRSVTYAHLAGALGASIGVLFLLQIWSRRDTIGSSVSVTVVTMSAALSIASFFHTDVRDQLPRVCYALVALAPLGAGVALVGPLRRRRGWAPIAAQVAATGLVLAAAVVVAMNQERPGDDEPDLSDLYGVAVDDLGIRPPASTIEA